VSSTPVAQVVVDTGTRQIRQVYSYEIPERLMGRLQTGHRVYVSFGRQYCQGFVVETETEGTWSAATPLKPIAALLDENPLLTPDVLETCRWLSWRYAAPLLDAIQAALPAAYKVRKKRLYKGRREQPPEGETLTVLWRALCREPLTYPQILSRFSQEASLWLESLLARGCVEEITDLTDSVTAKTAAVVEILADADTLAERCEQRRKRAPKQAKLLSILEEQRNSGRDKVAVAHLGLPASDAALRKLAGEGLIRLVKEEVYRSPDNVALTEAEDESRQLTPLQRQAVETIVSTLKAGRPSSLLLHGVTGSGKTEVYIQAIRRVLAAGGGAIVLVPEIVLTPQMVGRFVHHFGRQVAVLHSRLSTGERRDEWLRVRRGEARLVIGARSAVFAPVTNLKLLIVDEEHENSYKQEEVPYYDARQVAAHRAVLRGGLVVCGSATPSLQLMRQVETGQARLVSLPLRINARSLPPVELVDMREELKSGNLSIFSRSLQTGLEEAVAAGHQALLFLNRRGYASFVLCRDCGEVVQCPHCDISLTLHGRPGAQFLECHYCHFQMELPTQCPTCHEPALRPFGIGTEQVESLLTEMWPQWRLLRMDVDTTRGKGAHQSAVQKFYDGNADVLLGTQMIAKGLDFPNVTFVGVIAADTLLSVPDYRAAERTFSLLTQVAGRAGRADLEGKIVVQTYRPTHYAISAAAHHDFTTFYSQERQIREAFSYPPFCEMAVFKAIHQRENVARGAAGRFQRELQRRFSPEELTVLPASPDRLARMEDKFRFQVVVKYSQWDDVEAGVTEAFRIVEGKMRDLRGVCVLDVNAGRI